MGANNGNGLDKLNAIIAGMDIEGYLVTLGIDRRKPTRNGAGMYADCPFCGKAEKLSVGIRSKPGLWKCFACGEKGNLITLTARLLNCANGEAVKRVKDFAGVKDDEEKKGRQPDSNTKKNGKKKAPAIPVPAPRSQEIYQALIENTVLTEADRNSMRVKRGFTDETIDRLMFRSGGEYVRDVVNALRDRFAEPDLLAAGVLFETNGSTQVNGQLTDGRLLIPYLDEEGRVVHLRPHKLGFEGVAPQVYCRYLIRDKPGWVVLCEGEFKAVALWQVGIPAIAIPGISTFGDTHFDRLVEMLREFEIKQVIVIFDNEIKDDPSYPRYKAEPEDRYDTQYWNYFMGYKLGKAPLSFVTRVGWLPDEWRGEDGKADWDSALAAGHTKSEFLAVIEKAVTPKEFLENLPDEARKIVRRKLARNFRQVPVKRDFNQYVALRSRNTETWEETISNFVLNIRSNCVTPDGIVRNVELVNEHGEKSGIFPMQPGDMAGLNEWKKFLFSKGNYTFTGRADDLMSIWQLEFLRDTGDLIYMPEQVGLLDNGIWLFGNLAVKEGKIYRPDQDGVIWIDGKGYKPQSLRIRANGEPIEDAIPSLNERPVDMTEVARQFYTAVGGYEAYIALGWVAATIFSREIFNRFKCMPILWPHGRRGSGKSTLMRWVLRCFGVESDGVGISESTQNYIARALSYYSSLGCWFDEYRNGDTKVTSKDGFFRSAYNRQMSGKGTATAFHARGFAVNASLAISGEETPRDSGLFTRSVIIPTSAYRRNGIAYEWMQKNMMRFSNFTLQLILRYDELKEILLSNITELRSVLIEKGIEERIAENWAICAASFETTIFEDNNFINWVEKTCQEIKLSNETTHMLAVFWEDINYLLAEDKINDKFIRVDNTGTELYLWLGGVYDAWATYYRSKTGKEPFDEQSIARYLREEPYCVAYNKTRKFRGHDRKAYVINVGEAAEVIKEIAAYLLGTQSPETF